MSISKYWRFLGMGGRAEWGNIMRSLMEVIARIERESQRRVDIGNRQALFGRSDIRRAAFRGKIGLSDTRQCQRRFRTTCNVLDSNHHVGPRAAPSGPCGTRSMNTPERWSCYHSICYTWHARRGRKSIPIRTSSFGQESGCYLSRILIHVSDLFLGRARF